MATNKRTTGKGKRVTSGRGTRATSGTRAKGRPAPAPAPDHRAAGEAAGRAWAATADLAGWGRYEAVCFEEWRNDAWPVAYIADDERQEYDLPELEDTFGLRYDLTPSEADFGGFASGWLAGVAAVRTERVAAGVHDRGGLNFAADRAFQEVGEFKQDAEWVEQYLIPHPADCFLSDDGEDD